MMLQTSFQKKTDRHSSPPTDFPIVHAPYILLSRTGKQKQKQKDCLYVPLGPFEEDS